MPSSRRCCKLAGADNSVEAYAEAEGRSSHNLGRIARRCRTILAVFTCARDLWDERSAESVTIRSWQNRTGARTPPIQNGCETTPRVPAAAPVGGGNASVSADGGAQAAVVGVAFTDRFEVVFDTVESTRKAKNLRRNVKLAFVIGGLLPGAERTVAYEGVADEPTGEELERVKQVYYAVFIPMVRAVWVRARADIRPSATVVDTIQRLHRRPASHRGVLCRRTRRLRCSTSGRGTRQASSRDLRKK